MKILHINGNYIGTSLHQTMVEHLSAKNIINSVIVPNNGVDKPVVKMNDNVKILDCFNTYDRLFFFNKQRKIIDAIQKCVDIGGYDIIHAYTLFTDGYSARKISERFNKPFVVAVRNTDLNIFMKYFYHLRKTGIKTMLNAEKIFFLSKPYLEQMLCYVPNELKEIIREKSLIIPNGIDDFWINNKQVYEKKNNIMESRMLNIMYAGRIDANKNILITIEAMNILESMGYKCTLNIAGKVADQAIFSKISCDSRVNYYGTKSKEELIDMYRDNDFFVMPSFTETFGLVYAEAMSQGVPIIYTEKQGFDKQFDDGCVGFPVNPRDPQTIVNAILDIIKKYEIISKNCIEKTSCFDWNLICQEYKDLYTEICMRRRK